jgi:6-phosphogluconolactonase
MSLHVYTSPDTTAHALCSFILGVAAAAIKSRGFFRCAYFPFLRVSWLSVALSGGSLPALLKALQTAETEWAKWHVFFSDERVVPLDHADSNYKAAFDAFLGKVQH